jgi:hypothetical protein
MRAGRTAALLTPLPLAMKAAAAPRAAIGRHRV